jgi:hypothetical protein
MGSDREQRQEAEQFFSDKKTGQGILPVPKAIVMTLQKKNSVQSVMPDLLEEACDNLIRRLIILIRQKDAEGSIDTECIGNEV